MDVTLPPLAEGAESGTVVSVLVSVGDEVQADQTLIELENEKAIAPIPSTGAGTISAVHVKEGDTVAIGQKIVTIGGEAEAATEETPKQEAAAPQPAQPTQPAPMPAAQPAAAAPVAAPTEYQYQSQSGFPPPASPSVRRIAAEIGLDLTRVRGSENGGRIVMKDIKTYIQQLQQQAFAPKPQAAVETSSTPQYKPQSIDFSQWGPVNTKPYASMRKTIGNRMHESWSTIPHVYQMDEADITKLMEVRNKHKEAYKKEGAGLTLTSIAVKVVANVLKDFPMFNASLDEVKEEVVYKNYYNIAIAVDTEAGLVVPVIRDADKKDLLVISKELAAIAAKARERKLTAEDMEGSTFTISNLGGIGGTHFTPIVKKPDAAILGIGKGIVRPLYNEKEKLEARTLMPICVSYDHRIIDGADGARFVTALVNGFESIKGKDVELSKS